MHNLFSRDWECHSFKVYSCIYFGLWYVFTAAQAFSLVMTGGGSSLVAVHRFLIVVACLVAETEL